MRRLLLGLSLVVAIAVAIDSVAIAQSKPEFSLGFKELADQIPSVVGQPVENEHYAANGDSLQQTTTGMMAWRKADNWTAFTDGTRSWVNGPMGVQDRGNDERFDWEAATPMTPPTQPRSDKVPASAVEAKVTRVVDGESIDVDIPGRGSARVRYLGIKTPESSDPRRPTEYVVEVATSRNGGLVGGKTVYLEKDFTDADRDGRLLRYVYLADGTMVNQRLARDGFAVAAAVPPDTKYRTALGTAEREARDRYRGVWGPVEAFGPMEILPVVVPTPTP